LATDRDVANSGDLIRSPGPKLILKPRHAELSRAILAPTPNAATGGQYTDGVSAGVNVG
jgi:hypothetical protein